MSIPVLDDAVAVVSPLIGSLSGALAPVGGAAAAIVVCTAALRLLLLPLTLAAVRGERARLALAPRVAALRERHGTDPVQLGAEVTAMYRAAGVSPFAGLLPVLAQAPFFLLWYRAFTAGGGGLLDQTFLGATLASRFIAAPGPFLLLLGVLAGLAAVAAWRSRRVAATTGAPAPHAVLTALPFLTVVTATFLPLAAVLYMVTTVAWTTVENVVLRRGLPARSTRPDGAPGQSAIPQPANGVVAQRERRDSGGGDA